MPKLLAVTEAVKKDQAIQVWALLETNSKMTVSKACTQVGITPGQYRRWIIESQDALDKFRSATDDIKKLSLARILVAREGVLERLIKDALAPFTDPLVRLQIYQYLVVHTEDLLDATREAKSDDVNFLQGPTQRQAESRFSASEVEITIRTKNNPIIDITPTEP